MTHSTNLDVVALHRLREWLDLLVLVSMVAEGRGR